MHSVGNTGHKWNSTLPAKGRPSINMHKSVLQLGGGASAALHLRAGSPSTSGHTGNPVTCSALTPAALAAGCNHPPSQSPDANQSINNTELTLVAPPFTRLLGTATGQSSTNATTIPGVESSCVHFCKKHHPLPSTQNKTKPPPSVSFILLVSSVCS